MLGNQPDDVQFDIYQHMNLTKLDKQKYERFKELEDTKWMMQVKRLKREDGFGEAAMVSRQPRNASIQCLNDCYFAYLEKESYDKVLRKWDLREQNTKIDFFK